MQRWFDYASDRVEHWLATWWGCSCYGVACCISYWLWGWDGLDRWVYLSGAVIIILLIGAGRRDSKAAQAKLDVLTPDETLNRLEEKAEQEIEELRNSLS